MTIQDKMRMSLSTGVAIGTINKFLRGIHVREVCRIALTREFEAQGFELPPPQEKPKRTRAA